MKQSSLLLLFMLLCGFSGFQKKGAPAAVTTGAFVKIFDQSEGTGEADSWYINDHCFIKGPEGRWHMFGITGRNIPPNKGEEDHFAHAVADSLTGKWIKKPFALQVRSDLNETVLWAPHVVKKGDTYYMVYCGGHPDHKTYQINLATSKDLYSWTRYPQNPLFTDGYDARDPFLFYDKAGQRWILYYTATTKPAGGNHIVAARTSPDLLHWSADRHVVFKDADKGTWGGNTESPNVIQRGSSYYLFIGPGASYVSTKVYKSQDPFNWDAADEVAEIETHAAEIINDQGKWYVSHCGWGRGGLYLAPLFWQDDKVNN